MNSFYTNCPYIEIKNTEEWYAKINCMYIRLNSHIIKIIGEDEVNTMHKDMILKSLNYKLSNHISEFLYDEIYSLLKEFILYENNEWIKNIVYDIIFSINSTFIALKYINKLDTFNSHDIYQTIYRIITYYLHDENMNGILDHIINMNHNININHTNTSKVSYSDTSSCSDSNDSSNYDSSNYDSSNYDSSNEEDNPIL